MRTYDGDGKAVQIAAKGPNKIFHFCSYHQAVHKGEAQPVADSAFANMLVRVTSASDALTPDECCNNPPAGVREEERHKYCHSGTRQLEYTKMTSHWKNTQHYKDLMGFLEQRTDRMTEVKSVACFGLGRLGANSDRSPDHLIANYLQHIAALDIRNLFARKQKVPKSNIPIYTQDPAYCSECVKTLEAELGFEVLPSNTGFLKVDGNTFVMTIHPGAPIRQIIGDITADEGGPAGLFCPPIH